MLEIFAVSSNCHRIIICNGRYTSHLLEMFNSLEAARARALENIAHGCTCEIHEVRTGRAYEI